MLSACGSGNKSNEPIPTVVLDSGAGNASPTQSAPQVSSSNGDVTASGIVVSIQEAQLAFASATAASNCSLLIPGIFADTVR